MKTNRVLNDRRDRDELLCARVPEPVFLVTQINDDSRANTVDGINGSGAIPIFHAPYRHLPRGMERSDTHTGFSAILPHRVRVLQVGIFLDIWQPQLSI
jgi:hypothetical protein